MDLIVILPISMAEFHIVLRYAMFDLIFGVQCRHLIGRKPGMFKRNILCLFQSQRRLFIVLFTVAAVVSTACLSVSPTDSAPRSIALTLLFLPPDILSLRERPELQSAKQQIIVFS